MTQYPEQTLPCVSLLFPQCLAEIGEHQQLMLRTTLTKRTAPHVPTPEGARKYHLHRARIVVAIADETPCQSQFGACAARQACRRLRQQTLARAVNQLQSFIAVEGKYRNVNLRHHSS